MKIIFLDFDGTMDTARYELILRISGQPSIDAYGTVFDPECVWNLKQIIEKTEAKIVVSSSWKSIMTFEELLDMWEKRGLPGEVIDTTPYSLGCRNRGDEIDLWLKECGEECQYVILDDIDESNFNEHQLARLVVVDPVQGLNEEAAERVIKLLDNKQETGEAWTMTLEEIFIKYGLTPTEIVKTGSRIMSAPKRLQSKMRQEGADEKN